MKAVGEDIDHQRIRISAAAVIHDFQRDRICSRRQHDQG